MKKIRFLALFLAHLLARYARRIKTLGGIRRKGLSNGGHRQSPYSYRQRYLIVLVFIAAAGLLFVLWRAGAHFHSGKTISEGIVGVYAKDNLPAAVANLISVPLVRLDKSGYPQPELAASWQVNNDATLYTFKLKENLLWSDGTRLKASEIRFNLPDVEVSYPDDKTIQFKLADSFNPFPTLLVMPVFKGDSLMGTGKFRVADEESAHNFITKLTLAPNQEDLPVVIVRFYPDERTAKTAFELGEVESLFGISEDDDLSGQSSVEVKRFMTFNKLVAVFYNTKDSTLSDKNMRRALSAAAPNIKDEEMAKTSVPPGSWAYNDELKSYLDNNEKVNAYLDKVSSGRDSTITLTSIPALSQIGEKIVQFWKQAGIKAVLRVESGVPQNFQALLTSQSIPADPDQYALWHSTQTKTNISQYSSPRVDKDLEDGRKTGDLEERKEKYLNLQKVLLDDAPATFLYFPKTQVVYRKKAESNLDKILSLQFPNK